MTAAVTQEQPIVAAGNPLRPVEIRAHLLPPEIVAGRRGRRARRWVLTGLLLLVAVLGGWYALTLLQRGVASAELASAQDETAALTMQQRQYAELLDTQAQSQAIDDELKQLFAGDVRWPEVLSGLRAAAPGGVRLTGVRADVDKKTDASAPAADDVRLPSTADADLIGTVEITGVAGSKPQIAAYVDALAAAKGVADPYLDSAVESGDEFVFTIRLDLTADAIGGRYTDTGGN